MAEKIRVLFAIGEMSGGGSQRQLIGILQRLDRSHFIPYLYLVSAGGELLPEVPADVPVFVFSDRYRPPLLRYPGQAFRARVKDLAEVLKQQQIDVVYDRTYHMTMITAAATAGTTVARVSVIVADPQRDFEGNVERFRFVKRRLLARAYQTADQVVAVSERLRQTAEAFYRLPPGKAVTIYNFFDIERIDRLVSEPLPPSDVKQAERFEVVAAGRLHVQKGFQDLIEAAAELVHRRGHHQIHVRILGRGSLESDLHAAIARRGLGEHVTLAGFRPNPLPYFRQADLFCLSSHYEGMPNALVEAMLCRVPVLATDCPSGPREILQDGRLGRLVPAADPSALAAAVEDAVLHPDQWRTAVPTARAFIEENFSPQVGIQRMQELLIQTTRKQTLG